MPFKSIDALFPQKRGGAVLNGVRVARNGKAIRFSLGQNIQSALGWKAGDRVDIQIGDGPDSGFVKLERVTNAGGVKLLQGAKTLAATTTRMSHCLTASGVGSSKKCDHHIQDGALYVTLPPYRRTAANGEVITEAETAQHATG